MDATNKYTILTVGNTVCDITLTSPDLNLCASGTALALPIGQKNKIESGYITYGGGACNSALIARKLHQNVAICTRISSDQLGLSAKEKLTQSNISTQYLQISDKALSSVSCIIQTPTLQTALLSYKSNELELRATDITTALNKADMFDGIYFAPLSSTSLTQIALPVEQLRNRYPTIFLAHNPSIDEIMQTPATLKQLIKNFQLLVFNRHEAELFMLQNTGIKGSVDEILRWIADIAPKTYTIITDAEQGLYYHQNQTTQHIPAYPVTMQRTTGAGDTCAITCMIELLAQKPIDYAVKIGALQAAHALRHHDLTTGLLLNQKDLEQLLRKGW